MTKVERLTSAGVFLFPVLFLVIVAGLQAYEYFNASLLPGASLEEGALPEAADKAIDLYVEIAKSLLSFAIAALGGLSFLVQRDLENRSRLAIEQFLLTGFAFLAFAISIFFGILAIQFIADNLARGMAFATEASAGCDVDHRFRRLMRAQYFSFTIALAILLAEILRRLTHGDDADKQAGGG